MRSSAAHTDAAALQGAAKHRPGESCRRSQSARVEKAKPASWELPAEPAHAPEEEDSLFLFRFHDALFQESSDPRQGNSLLRSGCTDDSFWAHCNADGVLAEDRAMRKSVRKTSVLVPVAAAPKHGLVKVRRGLKGPSMSRETTVPTQAPGKGGDEQGGRREVHEAAPEVRHAQDRRVCPDDRCGSDLEAWAVPLPRRARRWWLLCGAGH